MEMWAQTGIVFYTWWHGDFLPTLPLLPGFRVASTTNYRLINRPDPPPRRRSR